MAATDAAAKRGFRPYWLLIRGFSGLIRRDLTDDVRGNVHPTRQGGCLWVDQTTETAPGDLPQ